jgi:hypothetical protein
MSPKNEKSDLPEERKLGTHRQNGLGAARPGATLGSLNRDSSLRDKPAVAPAAQAERRPAAGPEIASSASTNEGQHSAGKRRARHQQRGTNSAKKAGPAIERADAAPGQRSSLR